MEGERVGGRKGWRGKGLDEKRIRVEKWLEGERGRREEVEEEKEREDSEGSKKEVTDVEKVGKREGEKWW